MWETNLNVETFRQCQLCPRNCGIDRLNGQLGYCGETAQLRIATIESHFGEEPPISGIKGSGTIFFSGCSLKCTYCQNYQISTLGLGTRTSTAEVVQKIIRLVKTAGIHNVNFVTPDHFFPACVEIVSQLRSHSIDIPVLYNLSGYQKTTVLKKLAPHVDIYLVDYKYSCADLAQSASRCRDYPGVALDAITEMVRQKGFLDIFTAGTSGENLASNGVLVRHLILPGHVQNSIDALTTLFVEFGPQLPLSLMSQYTPVNILNQHSVLNRKITTDEFSQVLEHLQSLGFENIFIQYPENVQPCNEAFLPDFTRDRPFKGNLIR